MQALGKTGACFLRAAGGTKSGARPYFSSRIGGCPWFLGRLEEHLLQGGGDSLGNPGAALFGQVTEVEVCGLRATVEGIRQVDPVGGRTLPERVGNMCEKFFESLVVDPQIASGFLGRQVVFKNSQGLPKADVLEAVCSGEIVEQLQ